MTWWTYRWQRFWHHRRWFAQAGAAVVAAAAVTTGVVVATSPSTPAPAPSPSVTLSMAPDLGAGCGKERWDVKTLSDPLAVKVNRTPIDTTIAALRAMPAPVNPTSRTQAEEQVYRIHAVVYEYKEEADSDVHLAIKDLQGNTMIAELVQPTCVAQDPGDISAFTQARATWVNKHPISLGFVSTAQPVTLTGVLFFDRIHGQAGVAPNGVELHPVLELSLG